jgi:hypothetical protein
MKPDKWKARVQCALLLAIQSATGLFASDLAGNGEITCEEAGAIGALLTLRCTPSDDCGDKARG